MVRLKRAVWILPFVATVVVSAPAVHGEATHPDAVLGLRGGAVLLTQDPARGADSDVGPAIAFDGLVTIADSWVLGLGWLGASTTVDNLAVGSATVSDDVDMTTGLALLEYHPRFKGFAPYGVVGVGVTRVDFGTTTVGCNSNPLIYVICAAAIDEDEDESDTVFAAKVGVGLDYFFTNRLALNSEIAWTYNSPAERVIVVGGVVQGRRELDLSRLTALLGVRLYFNFGD